LNCQDQYVIPLILLEKGEMNYQYFIDVYRVYPNSFYIAINKLLALKLVSVRIDCTKYPIRKISCLTEKGRKIAEHLKSIEDIL
jgi:DNA-binding PadR family transcriptional regulator